MFNFQSLAEAITPEEEGKDSGPQFIEDLAGANEKSVKDSSSRHSASLAKEPAYSHDSRLEDSTLTIKPAPTQIQTLVPRHEAEHDSFADEIEPAPRIEAVANGDEHLDQKHLDEVGMMGGISHQATQ